ncbi:MAG: hypothetical protein RR347_09475 [Anaerovoracaceae bacterium]
MATKKEIKEILKELCLTEQQMDEFWRENYDTNRIVKNLTDHGQTWRDLNGCVVRQLPSQKQKDLETVEKKRIEDEEKLAKGIKEKQDKKYYSEHFEEIMVTKIDNKEELTENELSRIRDFSIEDDKGENRRWSRSVGSVLEMCDRYFMLDWEEGLTEYQDNEFYDQPYEVKKETYEKTISVTEWVKI